MKTLMKKMIPQKGVGKEIILKELFLKLKILENSLQKLISHNNSETNIILIRILYLQNSYQNNEVGVHVWYFLQILS